MIGALKSGHEQPNISLKLVDVSLKDMQDEQAEMSDEDVEFELNYSSTIEKILSKKLIIPPKTETSDVCVLVRQECEAD